MTDFPSHAQVLAQHRFDDSAEIEVFCHEVDASPQVGLKRGPDCQADWQEWVDHFADAWREACTISTDEELDAVPVGAIVRSSAGTIACRFDSTHGVVFGDERPFPWRKLALDALLLWHPGWERP